MHSSKLLLSHYKKGLSQPQIFMLMMLFVNGGNYLYNLILGHILSPLQFSNAAFLITALLSMSFLAMTFQMVIAKFLGEISEKDQPAFISQWYKYSLFVGGIIGFILFAFSDSITASFQIDDGYAIKVFAIGIPAYFLFNVQRGKLQSQEKFIALGKNYLAEMMIRFVATFFLITINPDTPTLSVSVGILLSIIYSCYIIDFKLLIQKIDSQLTAFQRKQILHFALVTIIYELTQNLLNSADILIVKHNYESTEAGLYASISLIGRMVYYITWMYAMIMLPRIVRLRKGGKDVQPVFRQTFYQVLIISFIIITLTLLFPDFIVQLLFGSAYTSGAFLLGVYALSTGLFCLSNILCYTYLSLSRYTPIAITAVVTVLQVVGLSYITDDLSLVVWYQVGCMGGLLILQGLYHYYNKQYLSPTVINHSTIAKGSLTK